MSNVIRKKALTIEDLVKFCNEKKMYSFNSKTEGYSLSVQVPATFEIEENTDDDHRGMLKLKFRIFHTGLNRNGSFVSEDSAKTAMSTIKNRPIMAAIHQLDNGEWDFEAHNFEIVEDEETGEETVVYIEKQVGSFDESEPFFEYDEELDKTFVCSYGYIPEGYTMAADIIRKKNGTKNSCELNIDEMSFNAKEHCLSLDKFYVAASTLLGSRADGTEIGEGMEGSRADIVDFSKKNNSIQSFNSEELLSEIKKLNENLSHININSKNEEGGKPVNKFEELLEKYSKSVEDIDFEYADLTDEELEQKFAELFGEDKTKTKDETVDENTEDPASDADEKNKEDENIEDEQEAETLNDEVDTETEDNEIIVNELIKPEKYSVTLSNGVVKEFSLSLNEINNALCQLVNETYGDTDDIYYSVDVFDDNTLIMKDWWNNKAFRQSYTRKDDNFSLIGDREEVFSVWLTKEEEEALNEMKANYSSISEKLAKYQDDEISKQKNEILADEAYAEFAETNEFKSIRKSIDSLTVEELKTKCELAFAKLVKEKGNFSFSKEKNKVTKCNKIVINANFEEENDSDPYGDYFKSLKN